jgi:LmbE family N-acetylglucosaminyl deacetylase
VTNEEQRNVAMVIVAHPDDAEFGCAGTVAAWARDGWEIYYAICTDASGGGPDEAAEVGPTARKVIAETRKAEQRAAAGILGVKDVIFLDYPDGLLQPSISLRRDLVRCIRQYRPVRVICPSPQRVWTPTYRIQVYHPDHLAAGQAALAAIYPAAQNPWEFPDLLAAGLPPSKVSEIYVMSAPGPNFAVDISSTLELKLAALEAHTSQLAGSFPRVVERMRSLAAAVGEKYGYPFAEEYSRIENTS